MNFPSILRTPDFVTGATDKSSYRFEEETNASCPIQYDFMIENNSAKVIIHPSGAPVKFLKLRFGADLSFAESVCGDTWVCCGSEKPIYWSSITGYRNLPWYFYLRGGEKMACYGVKTGADCFAFWQVDTKGITLFLNLTSGAGGTDLKESLVACEIVEYFAPDYQDAYKTADIFASKMCDKPNLPEKPIFGLNDWYWAYGKVTHDIVIKEIDILSGLTQGLNNKPFLVIDAGWQKLYDGDYIGGPWESSEKFGDIKRTSEEIHKKDINAGVWFRPILTREDLPEDVILRKHDEGIVLDPSHPYTLEKVASDVKKISSYGFRMIKHDFSVWDILGKVPGEDCTVNFYSSSNALPKFYDNTKTTATIIKELYRTIQNTAGKTLIMGCGVVNHLAAGIHQINRIGIDTSGRHFALTLNNGINSFMRLPQNRNFYITDHDCAAFTPNVPFEENLNFLELCAISGTVTMASITPDLLNAKELQKIADVFKIADRVDNRVDIVNFEKTSMPEKFIYNGEIKEYNWFNYYNGVRTQFNWME